MPSKIKIVTTYEFDDKIFRSLKSIDTYVDNLLGSLIDSLHPRLAPNQALDLLILLKGNSKRVIELLSVDTNLIEED